MKRLLVVGSLLASLAACSSSSSVDCERIAEHEFALTVNALPEPMQARARDQLQSQKRELKQQCEDDGTSGEQARCELAADDLSALHRCRAAAAE